LDRTTTGIDRRRCGACGRCRYQEIGTELAGGTLPDAYFSIADAACNRSRASISVHSEPGLLYCVAARASEVWQGDECLDPHAAENRTLYQAPQQRRSGHSPYYARG